MRIKISVTALILSMFFSAALASAQSRVMIVSIDGLRPDVALRAEMPNLRSLMKVGAYTFWAATTPAAITLPSHTSMVTGVIIEKHGISGNDDQAAANQKLLVPTIFMLAKKAGISSGMASGKSKFSIFSSAIDYSWYPGRDEPFSSASGASVAHDNITADHAVAIIHDHAPRLMLVHFGWNDVIGHTIGWGSSEQVNGLADTDKQLGRVLDALRAAKVFEKTTIIVTADHGGAGRKHGAHDEYSHYIPWVMAGPNVRKDYDLSQIPGLKVQTYDTFATACAVLKLAPGYGIEGKVIQEAFVASP